MEATSNDTILAAQRQMNSCALAIAKMSADVAGAKTVKEFHSDRLKRAFSVLVAEQLDTDKTTSAAEHYARASAAYGSQLNDLADQYRVAIGVIETAEALKIKFESARSILSTEKAKMSL